MERFQNMATQGMPDTAKSAINSAFIGGALGTVAFSAALRLAHLMGAPRFSVSQSLGNEVVAGGAGAYAMGAIWHFFNGSVVFPLLHSGLFRMTDLEPSATSGAMTGAVHGLVTGIGLNALRPRHGTFGMSNPGYFGRFIGPSMPMLWIAGNMVYGAVLGSIYGTLQAAARRPRTVERIGAERHIA